MLLSQQRFVLSAQRAARCGRLAALPRVGCGGSRLLVSAAPRLHPAHAVAIDVESSFSSLLDDGSSDYDEEGAVSEQEKEIDESLLVANLGFCPEIMDALAKRGIFSLFPVQAQVLEPIMSGRDVVCRAKTGSGKTLAFALPVIENLLEEDRQNRPKKGRYPRCVVMAPTRELANQTAREFETVCPSLKVESVYGGVSISNQMRSLERGVDVVVGTPGRMMDLMDRGCLKLTSVRYAVLDEADSMLDMGFEEDMERILGAMPQVGQAGSVASMDGTPAPPERQTLLFSATLPKWVQKVARKYQQNPVTIDLVGDENTGKLADTIRLLVQQVEGSQKMSALQGLLSVYGNAAGGGKAIVFVNTKAKADEVNMAINEFAPCDALHGDISQAQREKALAMFRDGKYACLVATDVAARGLDIPNVDLVVHYDVPQDSEAFLHRSGRTGRAGNKGTAVVLFTEREARSLGLVLKSTKVTNAELVGAPDPADVMRTSSRSVLGKLDKVDAGVVEFFVPAAERLLSSDQPSRVLAAALAALAGFRTVPQPRSLLTYEAGLVTLRLLTSKGMVVDGVRSLASALGQLASSPSVPAAQRAALADVDRSLGRVRNIEDQETGKVGLAFDLPTKLAETLLSVCGPLAEAKGWVLDKPRSVGLDVEDMMAGGRGGRGGGGGRSDRYGRSDRRGGGGYGDRGGYSSRSGYGGDRGGDRRGGGGGYGGGGYSSGGGGGARSYEDRRGGSGGGQRSSRGGAGGGNGGSYDEWSQGGWGTSSGRSSRGGAGAGAAERGAGGSRGGARTARPSGGRRLETDDAWGQW